MAASAIAELGGSLHKRRDVLRDIRAAALARPDSDCAAFIRQVETVPSWVDFRRMGPAVEFYSQFAPTVTATLSFASLVGSYTAAKGNKVLIRTGRLTASPEAVHRRLAETFEVANGVMQSGGLAPRSDGADGVISVRLLHEMVRRLCLSPPTHGDSATMATARPAWDVAALGYPVNQEDMLATLLAFSIVVVEGVRRLGAPVRGSHASRNICVVTCAPYIAGTASLMPSQRTRLSTSGSTLATCWALKSSCWQST